MLKAKFTKNLWHFTLDVELKAENQILVLWGPSGAGKTTVLQCLAGLINPSAGFINLNERTLFSSRGKVNLPARLRNAGYLFQDYALFPHLSVMNNVMYGLKGKRGKEKSISLDPVNLLNAFGVGHLVNRYPGQLSGGEKQRVALARALAVQPQLLLLDEPFSALDRDARINLRRELKEMHRQWRIPFVLVTHDEDDASILGDMVISLEKGCSREVSLQTLSR